MAGKQGISISMCRIALLLVYLFGAAYSVVQPCKGEDAELIDDQVSDIGGIVYRFDGTVRVQVETKSAVRALLPLLPQVVGLNSLVLSDTECDDTDVLHIKELRSLRELCIDRTMITDGGVKTLLSLPKLEMLSVCGIPISDSTITHFGRCNQLEAVFLDDTRISLDGLRVLGKNDRLTTLTIARVGLTDKSIQELKKLTKLKRLDLSGNPITDVGLGHLAECSELECLELRDTGIGSIGLSALTRSKLTTLYLPPNADDDAMLVVAQTPSLKNLWISGSKVTDVGIGAIAQLPNLEWLVADDTSITDRAMHRLTECRKLKFVSVMRTGVSATGALILSDSGRRVVVQR